MSVDATGVGRRPHPRRAGQFDTPGRRAYWRSRGRRAQQAQ